jgi:hypothetical protein
VDERENENLAESQTDTPPAVSQSLLDRIHEAQRRRSWDAAGTDAGAGAGAGRDDPSFADESMAGIDDKVLHERLPMLSNDELSRLAILEPGTRLEQGGVYLDLNRLADGPFKALGGHEATAETRYIAKRDTDYELWNRLAGRDDTPEIKRPE